MGWNSNAESTVMEKMLTHFVWLKRWPLSPIQCWSESCCQISLVRSSNIDWWGWGRIMIKARTSAFYWITWCPIFDFSGKYGDSCNKLHQVCQLFLSMKVEYLYTLISKSTSWYINDHLGQKKKELCLSFLKVKTLSAMRFFFFFFSQKGLRGCGNTP